MLILFGHGPVVAGQTFLAQENPPSSVKLQDLPRVLGRHFGPGHRRKLDLLVCQNCVMNGIETAFEVKEYVKYMTGSQGLVLATGWPYDKLIGAVAQNPDDETPAIADAMLRVCARNLLDFSIMDRSSEQSLMDLSQLNQRVNITTTIRDLATTLNDCLKFKGPRGNQVVSEPAIRDAVRLARLEAQSYWGENFVDLYDFCERLLKQCRNVARTNIALLKQLKVSTVNGSYNAQFQSSSLGKKLRRIVKCCIAVRKQVDKLVLASFYIGSELQYSHGISIYFPWSLPTDPYTFIPMSQGRDYWLVTAFETYLNYDFIEASGWGKFLVHFFRATLRNVRRAKQEYSLTATPNMPLGLNENIVAPTEVLTSDLQKSSPDGGIVDHEIWSNVKNYPRRNYLSPPDWDRRIPSAARRKVGQKKFTKQTSPPVSYLGWNLSGIVAEVVK